MIDNEIIKTLECCADGTGKGIIRAILDLINRQTAEIERLNAVSEICGDCHKKYAEKIERAKSEAIKEFAERMKICLYNTPSLFSQQRYIVNSEVDNLVEEMTVNYESSTNDKQRKEDGKNEIIYSENKVEFGRN